MRRVEALVGADAYQFLAREHLLVSRLTDLVKAPADELVERVERTISALKAAERDLQKVRSSQLTASMDGIIGEGRDIGAFRVWTFQAPEGTPAADLREMVVKARGRNRPELPVVMVGSSIVDGKVALVASANEAAIARGANASDVLKAALGAVDGRGGGKPDLAQGGGTRVDRVEDAFAAVETHLAERA